MAYTSPFQAGTSISATNVQTLVNELYSAKANRGLSNNSKPTFSSGAPTSSSSINTVISNCLRTVNYYYELVSTVTAETRIDADKLQSIEQYKQDLVDMRRCRTGCSGVCAGSCSGSGCIDSGCSGNCSSGCGNYCTGCSGTVAWGCVAKCGSGCSGTGSCKGNCSGSCLNGCKSVCNSECSQLCTDSGCYKSCETGCDRSNRIGTVESAVIG